ncbi:MAG: hypothetical protein ACT6T0_03590 [Nevskia sp.]|uniref:hypothetical protein n=1 Tax=Nevskia sp. TaxID=1929292 RepID=UPI004036C963
MLDYAPAYGKVIRHVRPMCACDACSGSSRPKPLATDSASAGRTGSSHLSAGRQVPRFAAPAPAIQDLRGRRNRDRTFHVADWDGGSTALLAPLAEQLDTYVREATELHVDDTPGAGGCGTTHGMIDQPAARS